MVVQVLGGTRGLDLASTAVLVRAQAARMPVGPDLVGRVLDGMGRPDRRRTSAPARGRARPQRAAGQPGRARAPRRVHRDRHLGDRRAAHARARPEAAGLLRLRPAGARARDPDRASARACRGSDDGFVVVFAAIGVTDRRGRVRPRPLRRRGRARALRRLRQPRRRAGGRATHLPARRADRGRVPRLRARPARARRARRHDQLLRGPARGRRRTRRGAGPARLPRLHVLRPRLAVRTRRAHPRAAGLGDPDPDPLDARRRRHASDPRRDGLHHRGPDRPLTRARPARDRPADRRAALAQPPHERRDRRRQHARATTAASPTRSPPSSAAAASCAA